MKLQSLLNDVLPQDRKFELFHLQSNPCEIDPIITPKKRNSSQDEKVDSTTVKIQHFFALAYNKKYVLALEIYVYITLRHSSEPDSKGNGPVLSAERLIFVSKADTNGYCDIRFSAKKVTKVILDYLVDIDPNHYLSRVKPLERKYSKEDRKTFIIGEDKLQNNIRKLSKRVLNQGKTILDKNKYYSDFSYGGEFITKISIFTRPANHYLFTGSGKNKMKHTLTGVQLMEWWLSIIDNIVTEKFETQRALRACLRIPGEDPLRVRRYLQKLNYPKWEYGDIFNDNSSSLAAFNIPLFPDDPKSRFLHQLVEENRILNTTLETFWFELQERQEFKLSVLVSVIGIEGYIKKVNYCHPDQTTEVLLATSLKQFSYLKNFITADEYDTEEGATESYCNICDYLHSKLNRKMITLNGNGMLSLQNSISKKAKLENTQTITILKPRKVIKK